MANPVSWFEIPTDDFERGIRFYEGLLDISLKMETMGPVQMAIFPCAEEPSCGAVIYMEEGSRPGPTGTVIYLNAGEDLAVPLSRVEGLGGAIIVPKTMISPEIGYFAVFRDSEGNHVGLYSLR